MFFYPNSAAIPPPCPLPGQALVSAHLPLSHGMCICLWARQQGGRCICAPKYLGQRVGTRLVRETWTKDNNGEFHGVGSRGPADQTSTTKLWARFRKSESLNSELRAPSTQHNAAVGRASPAIMLDSGQALPLTGWDSTGSSVPDLSLYMNNFRQYIMSVSCHTMKFSHLILYCDSHFIHNQSTHYIWTFTSPSTVSAIWLLNNFIQATSDLILDFIYFTKGTA
jgi:hypothetical protein